jgi:hypothetical protein
MATPIGFTVLFLSSWVIRGRGGTNPAAGTICDGTTAFQRAARIAKRTAIQRSRRRAEDLFHFLSNSSRSRPFMRRMAAAQ